MILRFAALIGKNVLPLRERERERERAWDKGEGEIPGNQVVNGRKTCEIKLVKMKNVCEVHRHSSLLSLSLSKNSAL